LLKEPACDNVKKESWLAVSLTASKLQWRKNGKNRGFVGG
jgi:hypothetical protein